MGLLDGKKAVIFGVANDKSIAYGIAKALVREGATIALFYQGETLKKRVEPIAEELKAAFIAEADLSKDEDVVQAVKVTEEKFGKIDILIHSVAFASRSALHDRYCDVTRAEFMQALDISVYTFTTTVKEYSRIMNENASALTLTYYGAQKAIPFYNVMGVAKAALEASVRYLALDFGPVGIRVNAISAGPIKTLSASAVGGFSKIQNLFAKMAPVPAMITTDQVGDSAVYLVSHLASGVTGEVHYVDNGFNSSLGSKRFLQEDMSNNKE